MPGLRAHDARIGRTRARAPSWPRFRIGADPDGRLRGPRSHAARASPGRPKDDAGGSVKLSVGRFSAEIVRKGARGVGALAKLSGRQSRAFPLGPLTLIVGRKR